MSLPAIADLASLGLPADELAARASTIGGSDANILASGNPERIYKLWQEKMGLVEREDLSRVLPVQMGNWTEPLNAAWFQQESGLLVTERNARLIDMELTWRSATLDGYIDMGGERAIFEAKHVNAFASMDETVDRYFPQLQHNMDVAGVNKAVLSVFLGTLKYEWLVVDYDEVYASQLLEIEKRFHENMINGTAPVEVSSATKPVDPSDMRDVDMTGNNEWASMADDYLSKEADAKAFEKAKSGLKKMVEADVKMASGHGLIIKRAAGGSLRFSKEK